MKKNNSKKILLSFLLVILLGGAVIYASSINWQPAGKLPDPRQELARLVNQYTTAAGAFATEGTIKIYDGENNNELKEETPFYFYKNNRDQYLKFGFLQVISNDSLTVQVDTANKYIIVASNAGEANTVNGQQLLSPDKFIADTARVDVQGTVRQNGKMRTIVFANKMNPEIVSYSVTYDSSNYRMQQSSIVFRKDPSDPDSIGHKKIWLAKIEYRYPASQVWNIAALINTFIKIDNGNISVRDKYRDFSLQGNQQ